MNVFIYCYRSKKEIYGHSSTAQDSVELNQKCMQFAVTNTLELMRLLLLQKTNCMKCHCLQLVSNSTFIL